MVCESYAKGLSVNVFLAIFSPVNFKENILLFYPVFVRRLIFCHSGIELM